MGKKIEKNLEQQNEVFDYEGGIAKKDLALFFVIDKSGSMNGSRIGAVNNAIRDFLSILPDIQEDTTSVNIKMNALVFSDDANWVYPELKDADDFKWTDVSTYGGTNFGAAYDELSNVLRKQQSGGWMPDFAGVAPIIIFMSDGMPNFGWENHLDELKKRGWFKPALRYAIAIEVDDPRAKSVLTEFTDNPERVITTTTAEALRKLIEVIAVTSTMISSQHTQINNNNNNNISKDQQVDQNIKKELQDTNGIVW